MAITKNCKQCQKEFEIADDDLEFYKKVSPEFGGKKFEIPAPTLCPDCRQQRRIAFRNERNLHKRDCDLSGKQLVTFYSPDKKYKVYDQREWWSDKWDPMSFGKDFDEGKSFFEQFDELLREVPRISLIITNSENSDFSSFSSELKNCYLTFSALDNENCYYGFQNNWSRDSIDCSFIYKSELCYEALDAWNCYSCKYIQNCENCSNVHFSFGCKSCQNCFLCTNLVNKKFCFENNELSEVDYKNKMAGFKWGRSEVAEARKKLGEAVRGCVHVCSHFIRCEDCTGDYLRECSNCKHCFDLPKSEDAKYIWTGIELSNCMDCSYTGKKAENCLDCLSAFPGFRQFACVFSWGSSDCLYCDFCMNCNNCFGCAGLKRKEFCILNKQYSKEEYEKMVPKIIEKMKLDGEWGEFFPISLSPFGYNETVAQEYYPLDHAEAAKLGAKWQGQDFSPKYEGEYIEPNDDVNFYKNNDEEINKLLQGVIRCEATQKPFKLLPQELAYYIENKIPIPTKHYDQRYKERFSLRNQRKLFHRYCMCEETGHSHNGKCKTEFETTYAPDRPEKIYCEKCYQQSVI